MCVQNTVKWTIRHLRPVVFLYNFTVVTHFYSQSQQSPVLRIQIKAAQ